MRPRHLATVLAVAVVAAIVIAPAALHPARYHEHTGRLSWEKCTEAELAATSRCGTFTVPENPARPEGRQLVLRVVVHPARTGGPGSTPVFVLAGGPGTPVTRAAVRLAGSPLRERHDIVLMDQRGTSAQMPLDCELAGSPEEPQGYFDRIFEPALLGKCRERLSERADLRFYSSALAADDIDALREALGARAMNLQGTSYGTRLALEVIRRHPSRVRAAYLLSAVPIAFKNPLYHARAAQDALDSLVADCGRDAVCTRTYPGLRAELDAVVARLREGPVLTSVPAPDSARTLPLRLTLEAVGEALRVMMYDADNSAAVLEAIHHAYQGEYRTLAARALASNRRLRESLRIGMLQSVVCSEDVSRITESEIVRETAGTMIGDDRVRSQMASCAAWPRSTLAPRHGEPVRSPSVPVLIVSGTRDPVTPVPWGHEAARHFARSRHLIVPGGHGPSGACVQSIVAEFFARASSDSLDLRCVGELRFPALVRTPEAPGRVQAPPPVREGTAVMDDGVSLHYRAIGDGPQTIVVPMAIYLQDALAPLAAPHRRLVFYDPRHRGRSGRGSLDSVSLDRQVRDLEALRTHLGADRITLIGWSGLGMETAVYMIRHPERVSRLVQVSPVPPAAVMMRTARANPPRPTRVDTAALRALDEGFDRGDYRNTPAEFCRRRAALTLPSGMFDLSVRDRLPDVCVHENEWPVNLWPYFGRLLGSQGDYDWRDSVATLAIPRLVIHGREDGIPLAGAEAWAAHPSARLVVFDGVGHYPFLERRDAFLREVEAFLREGGSGQLPFDVRMACLRCSYPMAG